MTLISDYTQSEQCLMWAMVICLNQVKKEKN